MSVNKAWQGKRFKTKEYKSYEKELLYLLKKQKVPDGKLEISLKYGFSSKASDIDNPTKLILDIFQKKFNFDDKNIYKLTLEKEDVKKGSEYFEYEIKEYNDKT